jgi:hypothetical protein
MNQKMDKLSKSIRVFLGGNAENPPNESVTSTPNALLFVHLNLIVYSCAFWMQQPVLPEKLKQILATEVELGSLQSLTAIISLLGSSFMGR